MTQEANTGTGSLKGKVAIVTGASRGIGAAITENLAAKGADIVLSYTSSSSSGPTQELAQKLAKQYGGKYVPIQVDLGEAQGPERLISQAKDHFVDGTDKSFVITILVNNAGLAKIGKLGSVTEDDFLNQYRLNVLAPLLLVQATVPYLPRDRSARIINVSSTSSANGAPGQSVYGGTKAALEAMTRTWARELSEYGTVNAINPGPVATEMFRSQTDDFKAELAPMVELTPLAKMTKERDGEGALKEWAAMHGRPGYPHEIAGIVGMLCSEESGWCTGSVVCANGGMQFSTG